MPGPAPSGLGGKRLWEAEQKVTHGAWGLNSMGPKDTKWKLGIH